MNDTLRLLQMPGDQHGGRRTGDAAVPIPDRLPDNKVDLTGFVFESDKRHPFRRPGPLSEQHQTSDFDPLTVSQLFQLFRGDNPQRGNLVSQELKRMGPQ